MEILKNDKRYINAPNDDYRVSINFESTKSIYKNNIQEYTVNQIDMFNKERDSCNEYLFYGKIEVLKNSLTHPLKLSVGYVGAYRIKEGIIINEIYNDGGIFINDISDFSIGDIIIYSRNEKFKLTKVNHYENYNGGYLLYLDELNVKIGDIFTTANINVDRHYKVLSNNFNIFKSGFSTNIYRDQIYQFVCNDNVAINDKVFLNQPTTEIFYRFFENGGSSHSGLSFKKIIKASLYEPDTNIITKGSNLDDTLIDNVNIDLNEQNVTVNFEYIFIEKEINNKIFEKVKIREVDSIINDSYNNVIDIPDYTTFFNDGTVFFKNILKKSQVQMNGEYDFPFINNMHYVYSNLIYIEDDLNVYVEYDSIKDRVEDAYNKDIIADSNNNRLC